MKEGAHVMSAVDSRLCSVKCSTIHVFYTTIEYPKAENYQKLVYFFRFFMHIFVWDL